MDDQTRTDPTEGEPVSITIRLDAGSMMPTSMRVLCGDLEQQRALIPRAARMFEQLEQMALGDDA